MASNMKKIQYSSAISDKVIPDDGVKSELLRQKVKFSSIGLEEYPHVSLNSYHALAGELISHYKTSNFKLLICASETVPEQKLSIAMGYWRRNPINAADHVCATL